MQSSLAKHAEALARHVRARQPPAGHYVMCRMGLQMTSLAPAPLTDSKPLEAELSELARSLGISRECHGSLAEQVERASAWDEGKLRTSAYRHPAIEGAIAILQTSKIVTLKQHTIEYYSANWSPRLDPDGGFLLENGQRVRMELKEHHDKRARPVEFASLVLAEAVYTMFLITYTDESSLASLRWPCFLGRYLEAVPRELRQPVLSTLYDAREVAGDDLASLSVGNSYPALDHRLTSPIRLLSLLPSARWSDTIECQLEAYSLADNPNYITLSYASGDQARTRWISVNGESFCIAETLESALRNLRHDTETRVFWVYGMCVNHDNQPERDEQVERMETIYQRAKRLLVWLGDDTRTATLAFEFMEELVMTAVTGSPERSLYDPDLALAYGEVWGLGHMKRLLNDERYLLRWEAVGQMLKCIWSWRVWARPEATQATNVLMCCGTASAAWSLFHNFSVILSDMAYQNSTEELLDSHNDGDELMIPGLASMRDASKPESKVNFSSLDLHGLLSVVKPFRNTNPSRAMVVEALGMLAGVDPGFVLPLSRGSHDLRSFTLDLDHIDEPYQFEPLPDASKYIRLLTVFRQSQLPDSTDIHCMMSIEPLDTPIGYIALSYTWGTPDMYGPSRRIYINGRWLEVGGNLYSALQHRVDLPGSDAPMWAWWIDAICINQLDGKEKSQQIMMMKDIYKNSFSVLVWLGSATSREHEAFTRNFRSLTGGRASPSDKPITLDRYRALYRENRDPFSDRGDELEVRDKSELMYELANKSWWQRVWVVQELCYARRAMVRCGDSGVSWEEFEKNLKWILDTTTKYGLSTAIWTEPVVHFAAKTCDFRSKFRNPASRRWGMLQVLQTFRHYKATDDRDKIFGLMGLVTDEAELGFEPDYSQPVSKVYTRLVKHVVETSRNLDILACAWPASNRPDLPSWAPDWVVAAPAGYTPLRSQSLGLGDARFSAGGVRAPEVHFSQELDTMDLTGIALDTVSDVDEYIGDDTMGSICRWYERVIGRPTETSAAGFDRNKVQAFFRTIVADTSMNGIVDDAYISTLQDRFAGKEPAQDKNKRQKNAPKVFFKRITFDENYEEVTNLVIETFTRGKTIKPWKETEEETFWEDVVRATRMRRFILSGTSYIGLAPIEVEVGDEIFIPFGGKVPVLIRAVAGGYRLVGECYIHGVMNGEAIREAEEGKRKVETVTLY